MERVIAFVVSVSQPFASVAADQCLLFVWRGIMFDA